MKNLFLLKCISILWVLLIPFIGYSQSINQSYPAAIGYTPYAVEASADGYHILSLKNRDTLIIEVDDKGQQLGIQKRDVVKAPIPPPGVNIVERVNNSEFMYMYNFGTTTLGLARVDQNGTTITATNITFPDSLFTNDHVEDYVEAEEILEAPDGSYYLKVRTGDGRYTPGYFIAKVSINNGLGQIHWVYSYLLRYGFSGFSLAKDGNCFIRECRTSKTHTLYKLDHLTGETIFVAYDGSTSDAGFQYIDDFEDGCTLIYDLGRYGSPNSRGIQVCDSIIVTENDFLAYMGLSNNPITSEDAISMTNFAVEDDYFLIAGRITTNAGNIEPYVAKANFDGTIEWVKILDFDLGYEIKEMNEINGRIFISGLKYGTPFLYEVDDFVDLELNMSTNISSYGIIYNGVTYGTIAVNEPFMLTLEMRNVSKGNFNATDIVVAIPAIPNMEILGTELSNGTIITTSEGMQWKIPALSTGETVKVIMSMQATAPIDRTVFDFAEVIAATTLLPDGDSMPNGNCCGMEDDETNLIIETSIDNNDNAYLRSQKEVNELTSTHINRLTISGSDIYDLSPLANIEEVNYLSINSLNTSDWSAFDDIDEIKNVYISAEVNEIKDAFNKIEHLESLTIENTDSLERIGNSFQQLKTVETLAVKHNKKLLNLVAFPKLYEVSTLDIVGNKTLSINNVFNALKFSETLYISGNYFSTIINSFQNLEGLSQMTFRRNYNLSAIPVFPQLLSLEILDIKYNESLNTILGFPQLSTLDELYIKNNKQFNSMLNFPQLVSLKKIYIEENESLLSIPAFPQLLSLDELYIKGNAKLSTISGSFNEIKAIHRLEIANNQQLTQIDNSFRQLEEALDFTILDHPLLTDIATFINVERANNIYIKNNDRLKNINNIFNELVDLDVLEISDNDLLEQVDNSFIKLKSLKNLTIGSNGKLENLPSFPSLEIAQDISLFDFIAINGISNWLNHITGESRISIGRSNLRTISNSFNQLEKLTGFYFYANNQFEELNNSFLAIAEIDDFEIKSNEQLMKLPDFLSIKKIKTFDIQNNPLLDDCCCIAYFITSNDATSDNYSFRIKNNATNCNSLEVITERCPDEDPLADLMLANIYNLVSEAQAGEVIDFNFDLKNIGTAIAAGDYKIEAYLRADSYYSWANSSYWAGELVTGNTPIGTIHDVYGAITIPEDIEAGDYYLELSVDTEDNIKELIEVNNILLSHIPIEIENNIILPDLVIDNIKNLPEKIAPGALLNFQFDLINKNNATAWGNYDIEMYFLNNSSSNVLLGTITTGNTPSGKIENIDISWPVPYDIGEGEYYLKIIADGNDDIVEPNNSNNVGRSSHVIHIVSSDSAVADIADIGIEKESPSIFDIEVSTIPEAAHLITKIYPNPVQDDLHIQVESKEKTSNKLVIYNSIGQVVLEELVSLQKGKNELALTLSDLQAGIYFVQIGVEQTALSFVKN